MSEKVDPTAPDNLYVTIEDEDGNSWTPIPLEAPPKEFKTKSVGYWTGGKITNPLSGAKYQLSMSLTLIGSKPE